jgi:hypothetical protein
VKFFVERPAATEDGSLICQSLVEAAAVIDESFRILCCVISLASRTARGFVLLHCPGLPQGELGVVSRVRDFGGQSTKGTRGMSWRQEAKKGVEVCEKPGEADKQAMIPGFLNTVN